MAELGQGLWLLVHAAPGLRVASWCKSPPQTIPPCRCTLCLPVPLTPHPYHQLPGCDSPQPWQPPKQEFRQLQRPCRTGSGHTSNSWTHRHPRHLVSESGSCISHHSPRADGSPGKAPASAVPHPPSTVPSPGGKGTVSDSFLDLL